MRQRPMPRCAVIFAAFALPAPAYAGENLNGVEYIVGGALLIGVVVVIGLLSALSAIARRAAPQAPSPEPGFARPPSTAANAVFTLRFLLMLATLVALLGFTFGTPWSWPRSWAGLAGSALVAWGLVRMVRAHR